MTLRLGDTAPDFTADSTTGPIDFHDWLGDSWGILFSHPRDFTPVCTTELGYVARLKPEFDRRNVKAIGLSIDPVESHKGWAEDIEETQGHAPNFPIIADPERKVAELYGMIHPAHDEVYTVRTVFVIDPKKKVRLMITYPQTTGRNFDEILRVIDSLQLTDAHRVATPVNWKQGEDVIIVPAVTDEEAKAKFPRAGRRSSPTSASRRSRSSSVSASSAQRARSERAQRSDRCRAPGSIGRARAAARRHRGDASRSQRAPAARRATMQMRPDRPACARKQSGRWSLTMPVACMNA